MDCRFLGEKLSQRSQTAIHRCSKFACSVATSDVQIPTPHGTMRVCPNSAACEGFATLAVSSPAPERPKGNYCYYTATNLMANIPMIEAMIHSARQAGVTEDIHAFTPGQVYGAINHPWDAARPWRHMQKIEILRDHLQQLDYEAFVWLDSDTWFVRHPGDMTRHLRSNPIWVLLESEMTDPARAWKEWWGAPFDELFRYFKTRGLPDDQQKIYNSNGGLFIVRKNAAQEFADRAFMIYNECKQVWPTTEDETPLALLGQVMAPDSVEFVDSIPDEIVSCDWHGHHLNKIPDGKPWPHKNWMTQQTVRDVNPPIVHAMRSKQAMQSLGRDLASKRKREPVGTKLHEVLQECGINKPSCGECRQWANRLDEWGVSGCQQNRSSILARLDAESKKASWIQWAKVAARGYLSSGMLLDEAIRRASTL